MITVNKEDENTYQVTIEENGSQTNHTVNLDDKFHKKLTGGIIPKEDLIQKSFEFLLERESKEMIMLNFDLRDISKYFPEFESYVSLEH
jgi:hypothetical protein